MNNYKLSTLLVFTALATGCASQSGWRPIVDPRMDQHPETVQRDMVECKSLAEQASDITKEVAMGAGVGAVTGAAGGAAVGAVAGSAATGAAAGAILAIPAGLVAITPAAGNVGIGGALVIGFLSGFAGLWGVNGLKKLLGADDSLDVFGVHGVCGILGAILTGVFNSPALGGPGYVADWVTASMVSAADYSIAAQVWIQTKAVLTTVVWSGVVSLAAYKIVDMTIGLRAPEEAEREGLDITSHGESAYGH